MSADAPLAARGPAPEEGPTGDALLLTPEAAAVLRRQLEAAYPGEGCGVLVGRVEDGGRVAERAVPADNRWSERDDRYLVDPGTLRRLLEEEDRGGARVLGFYHSHPDVPPRPSATDLEHAWPWYLYLLVRVDGGKASGWRAWELDSATERFEERIVEKSVRDANRR